jgi:hypothetical protein
MAVIFFCDAKVAPCDSIAVVLVLVLRFQGPIYRAGKALQGEYSFETLARTTSY